MELESAKDQDARKRLEVIVEELDEIRQKKQTDEWMASEALAWSGVSRRVAAIATLALF